MGLGGLCGCREAKMDDTKQGIVAEEAQYISRCSVHHISILEMNSRWIAPSELVVLRTWIPSAASPAGSTHAPQASGAFG